MKTEKHYAKRHSKVSESPEDDGAYETYGAYGAYGAYGQNTAKNDNMSAQRHSKVSEWGFYCSAVRIGRNVSEPPSQRECTTPEHPVQRLSNDSGWL